MGNKTVQTRNVSTKTIELAEKKAINDGLSSMHDAIRMFLTKYAYGELDISFSHAISSMTEQEYSQELIVHQRKVATRKAKIYHSVEKMIADIRSD